MRLPCASAKIYFEDYEDNSPRTGVEAAARPIFSSTSAIVAQDEHSLMRRISTWRETSSTGTLACVVLWAAWTSCRSSYNFKNRTGKSACATKTKTPRRKSGRSGKFGKHKKSDQPNESI